MSAGLSQDKSASDGRAGALAKQIRDDFAAATDYYNWLQTLGTTNAEIEAALVSTVGYTAAEASTIRNCFASIVALKNVAYGQANVPSANNFLFFAARLTGVY